MAVNLSDPNLDQMQLLAAEIQEHRRLIVGYQDTIDQTQTAKTAQQALLTTAKNNLRDLIIAMTA